MNPRLDLNGQNMVTVMLVQSLWGAVSPNFRMVALTLSEPSWKLLFVLEKESATDREEIEEVIAEFDSLLLGLTSGTVNFETQVDVNVNPLAEMDSSLWRVVFRRREGATE